LVQTWEPSGERATWSPTLARTPEAGWRARQEIEFDERVVCELVACGAFDLRAAALIVNEHVLAVGRNLNADGKATGIVETDARGQRISAGEINGVDFVADAREVKVPIIRRERESVSAAYNGNAAEDGEAGGIDYDDVSQ